MKMTVGKWSVIDGPPRIPSTLPPTDKDGNVIKLSLDEERAYCAEIERRILAYEFDPVNFFKVGKRG